MTIAAAESRTAHGEAPVIVSFYTDEAYYREAASRFVEDCTKLGLAHDVVGVDAAAGQSWIDVCRLKVSFMLAMHRKHERPILWLDVDSRIARPLDFLRGATCDVAGFMRGLRYLRDFDPLSMPRFFAPFALFFNATPRARLFLELMAQLEREHVGTATDDFFLQEAWLRHETQLSVMILPPSLVGREWPLTAEQALYVGISGNVSKFRRDAEQHTVPIVAPLHRRAVLVHEAEQALHDGRIDECLLLYERALAAAADPRLAKKVAGLMRSRGRAADADRVLEAHSPTEA